jgi:carboxyvinyl-carboxyphosphonate phosphorylmutase
LTARYGAPYDRHRFEWRTADMSMATRFKRLVHDGRILQMPSAYDCLSAKIAEQAGFAAIHMGGSGSSASVLGMPDLGFMTLTEMVEHARNMVFAVDVPVMVDADTGHGNALNVFRTVREFERAGAAALHLEDQVTPKKCGHFDGKIVIPAQEMVGKIHAAVEARRDPDFMIVVRTDAMERHGLDETIARANAYVDAGADCIYVEAMRSAEEMRRVREAVRGPLVATMMEGGKTPWFTAAELEQLGFSLVIYPISACMAAACILRKFMRELKQTGTTQGFWEKEGLSMSFRELFEILGYPKFTDMERRFLAPEELAAARA